MNGRSEWDDERSRRNEHIDRRWHETDQSAHGAQWGAQYDAQYDEGEDPGVTLVPQTPGQWAIALAVLALLVGGLGGVYWNSVSRQAAADEAISAAMARLAAASQSDNIPHSLGAALRDEMPMSGRYPVGPDGKLQRPKDAPTPEVPRKPDNMRFNTQEGAEAFTHYIIDTIEYMWATGDSSKFESLSSPDCLWCHDVAQLTKNQTSHGGWTHNAHLTVLELSTPFQTTKIADAWRISLKLELSPHISYDGHTVREKTAEHLSLVFVEKYSNGDWTLIGGGSE